MSNKNIKPFNRNAKKENITNNFTEDDVEYHAGNKRINYPLLDTEFDTVELQSRKPELVRISTIGNSLGVDHPNQLHRKGGSVEDKDYNKLERSFDIGIDLDLPCPVVYEDAHGELSYISGHTRDRFYKKNNFDWIMVYKYVDKKIGDKINKKTREFELLKMGQMSQYYNYHSTDPSIQDAEQFGLRLLADGHIPSDDNAGMALRKQYEETYRGQYFGPTELSKIIHSVTSQAPSLEHTVERRPMWNDIARDWMNANNYINTNTVMYKVQKYDMFLKAYAMAVLDAQKNPDKTIRLVFHAGVLDGLDPENMYNERKDKCWNGIKTFVDAMQMVIFNNKPQKPLNIEVYGMIPQLGSHHNFQLMNRFNKNGEFKVRPTLTNKQKLV